MASKEGATPGSVRTRGQLGIDGYGAAAVVGQGPTGVVYRARDRASRRTVAVKVFSAVTLDDDALRRFDNQRAALGTLSGHPNIVAVYDTGLTSAGVPYVVMEYLIRGSLAAELERMGPVPWRQVVAWGIKAAGALESAHRVGLFHGAIKPENVLLSNEGDPKLTDFGAAHIVDGRQASVATDVSMLAATLMTLALGRPPSDDDDDVTVAGAPAGVQAVFDEAMGGEYLSAAGMGRALQRIEEERRLARTALPLDVLPPPSPKHPEPERRPRRAPVARPTSAAAPTAVAAATADSVIVRPGRERRAAVVAAAVVVLVVVVGVAAVVVVGSRDHSRGTPAIVLTPTASALPPGTYRSNIFKPDVSFRVGSGWTLATADTGTRLELTRADNPGAALGFHLVDQAIDPASAPGRGQDVDPTVRPLPADAGKWLRDNPRLQVRASGRTKIGVAATFVEFAVANGYRFDNGNQANPCTTGSCVMLFRTLDLSPTLLGAVGGDTLRFYLIPEGSRLLVVTVSAPAVEYPGFISEAQRVLATLKVGST